VADVRPPQEWVGREVNVVFQSRKPDRPGRAGGPAFDSNSGTLADANDLGVTLELADGTMTFIPWTAIRRVTLLR
jgi:hypothetical protein